MPYTKFRYIAYQVPTATQDLNVSGSSVESGFAPGTACNAVARIPVPGGIPNDASVRLHRLAAIVDRAATRLAALGGDDANTLKIFMAPEFYFRPPSSTGVDYSNDSYPRGDMARIINAFDTMFQHADFTNWLIVPGTVVWNSIDTKMKTVYLNTAVYIKGGPVNKPVGLIEKNLASGIDGLPQGDTPGINKDYKIDYESWSKRKSRVFNIGGVDLGLEICLDHANSDLCKNLRRVLNEWTKNQGTPQQSVALHLLTAGGMPLQTASISCVKNGYVLRNDGFANDPRVQLVKVNSYAKWYGMKSAEPYELNAIADITSVGGADSTDIVTAAEKVPMKGGTYFEFPQRILIYPAKNLP